MSVKSSIKFCSICGFEPLVGRGLCRRCYNKAQKNGTLTSYKIKTIDDVFMERILKTDTCWIWQGTRNAYGYGVICIGNNEKYIRAHRFVYEKLIGPIPEGMVLMHSCDNPPCVNPAHLSVGTKSDNNRDAKNKRRNAFGERNGQARLTVEQIIEIRSSTLPRKKLAEFYGVDLSHICRIQNGNARING